MDEMQEMILQAKVVASVLGSLPDFRAREEFTASLSRMPLVAAVTLMADGYSPPATEELKQKLFKLFPFDAEKLQCIIQPSPAPDEHATGAMIIDHHDSRVIRVSFFAGIRISGRDGRHHESVPPSGVLVYRLADVGRRIEVAWRD